MVRVKVCGITRADDAELACELGASALGFVFWPSSPRYVHPDSARAIVSRLPPFVTAVGVFVDQPLDHVEAVARTVPLGAVQLHGGESGAFCARVGWPVIKAVPIGPDFDPAMLDALPAGTLVLLDADDPVRRGGTGRTIDWSLARRIAAGRPAVLAGGLAPDNVRAAIRAVGPHAVDVSSGVESEPGIKDSAKLRAFFAALTAPPGD